MGRGRGKPYTCVFQTAMQQKLNLFSSQSFLVPSQTSFSTFLMIHHPLWVSPLFGLNRLSSIIWVMDGLALNTVQFGYPRPDILAVWIELLTLQQRIKDSQVGLGIDSRG